MHGENIAVIYEDAMRGRKMLGHLRGVGDVRGPSVDSLLLRAMERQALALRQSRAASSSAFFNESQVPGV
jgi:hypothetical protein